MDIAANELPKLVDRAQVAEILGVSRSTITRYEKAPEFPSRVILPGGSVRYLLSDLTSYIDAMRG